MHRGQRPAEQDLPGYGEVALHRTIVHRPVHRGKVRIAPMIHVLPCDLQQRGRDEDPAFPLPEQPLAGTGDRSGSHIEMRSVERGGGTLRIVFQHLPLSEIEAVAAEPQVAGNADAMLYGRDDTFRIRFFCRVGFQNTGVSDTRLETVGGTQHARHIPAGLLEVVQQQTALAAAAFTRYGSGDGRGEAVGGILQAHARLVALLDAVRIFRALAFLDIEEVVIQLRIDRVAKTRSVQLSDIGMELYAHFV